MKTLTLPNGDKISIIDRLTAEYVYDEIYVDKVYLKRGINVKDGDVILDVGANIGLFSRFISTQANNLKIFTFEPIPAIFNVLEANLKDINADIKNFNIGLGKKEETLDITYYPKCSGDSAIIPFDWDLKVDLFLKNYEETICKDMPQAINIPEDQRKELVEAGLKAVYRGKIVQCQIRPLSQIIQENNIEQINLMKIDAENYEWQVLAGIKDDDWGKIQQIAMEVHTHIKGGANLMNELTNLLEKKGFSVEEGDPSLETIMGVYMLYAKKE